MKPNHVHIPLRAMGVLALFILVATLAMHTGLAAPQAQAEEPVLTPTAGIEPTPTPTPTETIILPEPTITPLPSDTPDVELLAATFAITFTPDPVAPGDVVTASWLIPDYQGSLDGVELWFTLPTGFLPVEIGSLSYDSAINQLALPLSATEGKLSWYIDAKAQPPFDCLVEVRYKDQVLSSTKHSLGLRSPDLVSVDGGEASGYNGNIRVSFPAGALPEDADVLVRPPLSPELSLGGNPVELTAIGRTSGEEITKFAQPVTITIQYTDEQANSQLARAGMLDEHSLTLFYYDEIQATWRALPTTVDPEANLLTAVTDHFTLTDFKAQNWEAARLPSMAAFQVDSFTGAGTYSIPIQVPAGPAGLQPSLTLSYNSQVVDSASTRSQASWVGMGWSLDTGYIQRSMNGTPNYLGDDTFTLQANGVGGLLLPIPDQDGDGDAVTVDYHLANENFWRIRQYKQSETINLYIYDRSYWVVSAPDGSQYIFGRLASGESHLASYPAYLEGDCTPIYVTAWQWPMTRVRNVFGEELSYTYSGEMLSKVVEIEGYNCTSGTDMAVSLYPLDITYANNRYRIEFVREQVRTDHDTAWTDINDTILFMRSRLQRIEIWHDPDGVWDNGDKVLIRQYVFGYGENSQQIMPGNTWPAGGMTPTLTSVTEYGLNGATSLPATTFTYDALHLLQVDNGYGGQVNLGYNEWHAENSLERIICTYFSFQITSRMDIISQAIPDCTDVDGVFPQYYQPGGSYVINLQARSVSGSQIKVGFDVGEVDVWSAEQSIPEGDTYDDYSFQVTLPGSATQARPLIWCTECIIKNYEIRPVVTRYRVISQALTDQITEQTNTRSYSYSGAAVNDPAHSALANQYSDGVRLLVDPYAEFRGHSQVTVTAPDGGYTISTFDQSDLYKGRATLVETFAYGGARLSRTEMQYTHEPTTTDSLPHPEGKDPWADLLIEWVYTTQNTAYTYNGDSTWVAKRTWYEYKPSEQGGVQYGNLTRTLESQWDSQEEDWRDYRLTRTLYYPNNQSSGVYLTGLPAIVKSYTCPVGKFNGACSTDYPSYPPEYLLAGVQWYLYDNHHPSFNTPPDVGILTGMRQLLYCDDPGCGSSYQRFSDQVFTYDAWGNRTTITAFSDAGTFTAMASTGDRTSAICYGGGGTVNGDTCADDGYHTYPRWEQNAEGHPTTIEYTSPTFNGFALGVPVSMTDPNNITTAAGYDSFGRLTSIVRVFDDANNPTVSVSYHEPESSDDPFYTEARQRIDGTRYFTIRKYYGGLGTLLETQVLGAEISGLIQDVVVSSWQGYALEGGQVRAVQEQSVPYAIPNGYGFRGWDYVINNSYAYSRTVLDELGRPLTVTAPDGSSTSYDYAAGYSNNHLPFLQTTVTDAENHSTVSYSDIWGRTVLVDAPVGADVSYTYDVANRLVSTTYGSALTTLTYDLAGRKTQMTDADMGTWSYRYNALGELERQTDARGQRICLYYDDLGRLTGKHYRTDDNCPATPTLNVSYIYDQGANGVGQRTRMDDGTGYTTWSYDARGRVIETYQSVTSGKFRTQWSYNSADLPVWMKYPSDNAEHLGETVNYTYNTQMLLDRVYGTDTYVDDTWYDAAGRVTLRELGNNYTLGQSYTYFPWTQQGGRLQSLQSGIPSDQDSLQSLSYSYDEVGNVATISDYHATSNPSDPQVQAFGYDALDRLINAQATNGETGGRYPQQSYGYNEITGNMATNAGMSYAYTYPNAPAGVAPAHGVRQVTGGIGYNGTVAIRARRGTGCTTSPEMKLYINGTFRQQWTVTNKSSYTNYSVATNLTTDAQVDVVFSNATSGCTLQVDYVTLPTATGTRTVQAESGGTIFDRGSETGAPGANAFDGVNVLNGAELMTETGSLRFVVGLNALAAGYDANGNMTLRLKDGARYFLAYDAESRLTSVSGTASASFAYNGDGQRVSATIDTTITTYIGGYFEWKDGVGTSYYFAGAQRIAMRTGAGSEFLLGDHLGSTSLTVDSLGGNPRELRYYPWGGVRWTSGASPTDYLFTGQQEVDYINLYWYGSRWYDPALGRFVSPDTIVPGVGEGGNPNAIGYLGDYTYSSLTVDYHEGQFLAQLNAENNVRLQNPYSRLALVPTITIAFDRYAYSLNNPIMYVDPSGHFAILAALAAFTPIGWVAIGVATAAVVLYYAVGGPEVVTNGIYQAIEAAEETIDDATSDRKNDENQEALIDLAQEVKQQGGVSEEEAETMLDWANEYNVVPHSSDIEQHPNRNFNVPHIRIGPINHIPVHGR